MEAERFRTISRSRKTRVWTSAAICILIFGCTTYPTIQSPLRESLLGSLSKASVKHIEETDNAGVHAAPYKSMAERILQKAGFQIADSGRSDFQIIIRTRTEPIKTRYVTRDGESFHKYTGVRSAGTIEVVVAEQEPMVVSFSSYQEPTFLAKRWEGEDDPDPAEAPYGDAFKLAGGFYDGMNVLLLEQIPQERLLRMLEPGFSDLDYLDYKGRLIRFLHERRITSAGPNLMRLLNENEFSCKTICPVLTEWKYGPVLEYAIRILGSDKQPYDLQPVFETHIKFRDRRSMPSLIAFLRTVDNPEKKRDVKHQQMALQALRVISGQDMGNDPEAWAEWLRAQR